jgi:hypothetical protein
MSVLDLIALKTQQLPPEMQQEVLHFVEFLNNKQPQQTNNTEDFPRLPNIRGAGKQYITYVADDFDAPLEDLKEYM